MDDDKRDGLFNNFFGGDFDKHFKDAFRDMDEMFRKLGDFHIDFQPPSITVGGNPRVPGYNESPRDMMLKDDVASESDQPHDRSQRGEPGGSRPRLFHPGFRSPFHNQGLSDSMSEITILPGSNAEFRMSSQSTSISHNPDGSMEKIVKTNENGQKCTTVTKTDKDGNTSTTTTCDRPGDIPNVRDKPPSQLTPFPSPAMPSRTSDDIHDQDKTIFQKYFNDWFKPKDR